VAPLGWPRAPAVVPGPHAAGPLVYARGHAEARQLGAAGGLYVGDGKMAALESRALLHAGQEGSLGPLSALQGPAALWAASLAPGGRREQDVTPIDRQRPPGPPAQRAAGDEWREPLTAGVAGETCPWTERPLGIRSRAQAHAGEPALRARRAQAQTARASRPTR
jgi:hypothetical protein